MRMKWTKMQGQTSIPYHPLKRHNNNNYQAMIPSIIIAPPVQKTLSPVVLI